MNLDQPRKKEKNNLSWEEQFEKFYKMYPKKVKKQNVKKWFEKNKPSNELFSSMLSSLEQFRASAEWQKDGGQYIPYPSSWLNQKRWEDEFKIENEKIKENYKVIETEQLSEEEYIKLIKGESNV